MAHIFISYHHTDTAFAELLEAQLHHSQLDTWRDQDLRAGESWRDGIDDAIREAAAVILLLSPAAKVSPYVNYEWAFALGAEKKVITLLLGVAPEELHPRLAPSQALDFSNPAACRWDKLIQALEGLSVSRRPTPLRGVPPVVEQAARALDSLVPDERIQAIRTLAQTDHPTAREVLAEKGLCHLVREVRVRAAFALAKLEDLRAVRGLLEVVRIPYSQRPQDFDSWVSGSLLAKFGPPAVPELIRALEDAHPDVRWTATSALAEMGHDAAIPGLVETLRSENSQAREIAIYSLRDFGPRAPVQPIAERLADEYIGVRRGAAEALGKIGSPEAVTALIGALGDSEDTVRLKAVDALGEIGDRAAVPALLKALRNDSSAGVCESAAKALAKIGGPEAVAGLLEALANREFQHRRHAAAALGEIKDPEAVPGLMAVLTDEHRLLVLEAARALNQIGTPQAKAASAAALGRS